MTEAQAIEFISAQFVAAWPAASGGVPIALDNEAHPELAGVDTFAQLTIQHTASRQLTHGSVGTRRWLRMGVIYVRLWVAADRGRAPLAALCDAARSVFEGIDLGTGLADALTIEAGQTREVGPDGQQYMAAVQFGFRYYQTR